MTRETRRWHSDHAIVVGGVLVFVMGLLAIAWHAASANVELAGLFATDPSTGFLLDRIRPEDRGPFAHRIVETHWQGVRSGVACSMVGTLLAAWGARRLGRRHGVRVGLLVSPVIVPMVLGLLVGLLANGTFHYELEDTFEALGGQPRHHPYSCFGVMTACSRLQALDAVWPVATGILCVLTAIAFLVAAPRAWRAGVRGVVLPRGWAIGSIVVFGLGAIGLALTMPHAADLERAASECEHEPHGELENTTSTELRGVVVESCELAAWQHPGVPTIVALAYADTEGWVSVDSYEDGAEYLPPAEFEPWVGEQVERVEQIAEVRGEDPPPSVALALYVDERTPMLTLREHLLAARRAGITDLALYGQAFVEGGLETQGEWTRRILCPAGWIHFDDRATLEPIDFETWGSLHHAAMERGDDPLPLRLPITPRTPAPARR